VTLDKLTEAYLDARHFERNVAVVQVLLDHADIERKALEGDRKALQRLIGATTPDVT